VSILCLVARRFVGLVIAFFGVRLAELGLPRLMRASAD
jgi:hypothetical protein